MSVRDFSAILHSSEITELSLIQLRTLSADDAAAVLDDRLRVLEAQYKRSYAERGLLLLEMKERQLWKHLRDANGNPFTSFERYICEAAPYSRRDCFAALAAVKELRDISASDLMEVPRCNISVMTQLSPRVRSQPEVLKQAKNLSEREFRSFIGVTHPTEHIPSKTLLEQACEIAMELESCGRRVAEDVIAEFYIAEHAEAYERVKGPRP